MKDLKVVDIYPGKKNGYLIENVSENGETYDEYVFKEEYEMKVFLSKLNGKTALVDVEELKSLIGRFGDFKYYQGELDEHMNNTGEEL
jgi:hypothetical protein